MTRGRKILTTLFLLLFCSGAVFLIDPGIAGAFTYWFFLAVLYVGLWFLIGPTKAGREEKRDSLQTMAAAPHPTMDPASEKVKPARLSQSVSSPSAFASMNPSFDQLSCAGRVEIIDQLRLSATDHRPGAEQSSRVGVFFRTLGKTAVGFLVIWSALGMFVGGAAGFGIGLVRGALAGIFWGLIAGGIRASRQSQKR